MAFVNGQPRVLVNFMDSGENPTQRTYELKADAFDPATDTIDDAYTLAAGLVTALTALTGAEITGYSVVFPRLEDDISVPGAGVQIEEAAELNLRLDAPGVKTAKVTIPAPVSSIFVAATGKNSNIVKNPSDSASLAAFVNWLIANATVSDGEDLAAAPFVDGRRIHNASRRG